MNEILNGHGLRGDLNIDWSDVINSFIKTGGEVAAAIINKGNSQNTNTNTNANGGGGTVTIVQQDKTLLYIGVGALALMAIFMITNSGRRK